MTQSDWQVRDLHRALSDLLLVLDTEGMLHSERCSCDFCEYYRAAEKLVDEIDSEGNR